MKIIKLHLDPTICIILPSSHIYTTQEISLKIK